MEDLHEYIGVLADRVDSLLAAEALPLPKELADQCRREALKSLRDDIRAKHFELTGTDVWSV